MHCYTSFVHANMHRASPRHCKTAHIGILSVTFLTVEPLKYQHYAAGKLNAKSRYSPTQALLRTSMRCAELGRRHTGGPGHLHSSARACARPAPASHSTDRPCATTCSSALKRRHTEGPNCLESQRRAFARPAPAPQKTGRAAAPHRAAPQPSAAAPAPRRPLPLLLEPAPQKHRPARLCR